MKAILIEYGYHGVKHADLVLAAWDAEHTAAVLPANLHGVAVVEWMPLLQPRLLILREDRYVAD
jgi:hypothetical protein